ncbi:hypothetical protein LTR66_016333 [Elasticomyces elasticus]|nr:hypothetical protein LTR66_016333 [Elasticomyces elasticus]
MQAIRALLNHFFGGTASATAEEPAQMKPSTPGTGSATATTYRPAEGMKYERPTSTHEVQGLRGGGGDDCCDCFGDSSSGSIGYPAGSIYELEA